MLHGVLAGALSPVLAAGALLPLSVAPPLGAPEVAAAHESDADAGGEDAGVARAHNGSAPLPLGRLLGMGDTLDSLASHSSALLANTLLAMVGVGLLVALQRGGVPALPRERRGAKGLDPRANPELQGPFSPKHASPLRPSY